MSGRNKVDIGFEQAQSDNLPKVDTFMVFDYLSNHLNYTSAEIRGWKLQRSGRESYGDEAVGFVQVQRTGDICTVKAKITPEHKIKCKAYCCTFTSDETQEIILNIECHDCAAQLGGCKHGVAFLMWLHRRSEEPSPTEKKCYWAKPKLATVGTTLKFIKAKDMGSGTTKNQVASYVKGQFVEAVKKTVQEKSIHNQLAAYCVPQSALKKMSLHALISEFRKEGIDINDAAHFIDFCSNRMTIDDCSKAEEATLSQADSPLWRELRYCRVTASKIHEATNCKTDGVLVEQIFGASIQETVAMERGKRLEPEVKAVVAKIKNTVIVNCGLFLKPEWPILGASPDGLTPELVVEIKCPMTIKGKESFVKNNDLTKKSKAQIQLQMFFCNRNKGLFCIADVDFENNQKVDVLEVEYDNEYCMNLLVKATNFWKEYIFPKLMDT